MKKKLTLLLSFLLIILLSSCHFFAAITGNVPENITLTFSKTKSNISINEMDIINVKASSNQNGASIKWEYDSNIISAKTDNYSAVITGLKTGTTTIKAICGSNSASCVVTVNQSTYITNIENPYVYANTDYIDVKHHETIKLSGSLYGGTPSDINGFKWTIDKPSIASITTEGNYCWVSGLRDGIAKITLRHPKASYGYSILVNCSENGTSSSYITTENNIITINMSEDNSAEFKVDLVNPTKNEYFNFFEYSIVDSIGSPINTNPIVISSSAGGMYSLKAFEEGNFYIRIKHPDAIYPLDILVRVIQNASSAYIEPSNTIVTVSDKKSETVTLSINNYNDDIDPNLFTWSFSPNAEQYIDYIIYNGSTDTTGDNISIKGKKAGNVKITVNYKDLPSRNIVVLIRDIDQVAADATTYITTSQNYIKLSTTDEPQRIDVTLKNAKQNEIEGLSWTITNKAKDNSTNKVINWKMGNGTSTSRSIILADTATGYAVIEPVNEGTAYIDITHPKALYPTRITVVVEKEKVQQPEECSLSLIESPVLKIKNGETKTTSIDLIGRGNPDLITWSKREGSISITPNGKTCSIQAPTVNSGSLTHIIEITHPQAHYPLSINVITYDKEEELKDLNIKTLYSHVTQQTIKVGNIIPFYIETTGFGNDTPQISYQIMEGENVIQIQTENNNKILKVTGINKGRALIKASCVGTNDLFLIVKVESPDIIEEDKPCYLSTNNNVLYFNDINEVQDIEVSLVNMERSAYKELKFSLTSKDFDIAQNDNKASITSLSTGAKAVLTISHPLSENELTVYLRTGERYEYINPDTCYITTNQDVFDLYQGQDEVNLVASLKHTEKNEVTSPIKGFTFTTQDTEIINISYVNLSNICYIKPLKNGTAKIKITHPDSDFEKEVIVIVNNTPNFSSTPYITTDNNVINTIAGNFVTANVKLMNSTTIDNSLWKWESMDPRVCTVIANNGTSAMISANNAGTTEIKITHKDCLYPLKLIITVLDSNIIQTRPYIETSEDIITISKGETKTITAKMIGGNSDSDSNYFRFIPNNSSIVFINPAAGSCAIKGFDAGMAYITVSNSRYNDSYSKTVLVIVEDTNKDGVYIKPSSNIVKMKPDSEPIMITSELVNGEPTDSQNMIWWADDYSLINISSMANQCLVTPLGKSGTTKLHIKHEKAKRQVDIVVSVSNYSKFAFNTNSTTIESNKLYFFPLQVPAVDGNYNIKYSSTSDEICLIQGSSSVAWVCGRDYGNATLKADMVDDNGNIIASTEMLVSVNVPDPSIPSISLGNSIMTVEKGQSYTLKGTLNGDNIADSEKYNLQWRVKDNKTGLSFLNANADNTVVGAECYVTCNEAGDYVIECFHSSGAVSDLYLVVEDKGELGIELNSNLETIYKDDGSITLTAKLINGTEADYQNISWSAVKVGGQNIVAVSKSKGKNCTVTPRAIGQTNVIARLPNGKMARCIVIVKPNAELFLDTGTVHVIPGYTEIINYKTTPENSTINWLTQMNSDSFGDYTEFFSIEDDTVRKQLRITGLKNCPNKMAGTIMANLIGSSPTNLPKIKVYCEYKIDLELKDTSDNTLTVLKNNNPDTKNITEFDIVYHPIDLHIDIKEGANLVSCINSSNTTCQTTTSNILEIGDVKKSFLVEDGVEKCKLRVSVVPKKEGHSNISIIAKLPNHDDTNATKEFTYIAAYNKYNFAIDTSMMSDKGFSYFDESGVLHIGDGEEATFALTIANENADASIEDFTWVPDASIDNEFGQASSISSFEGKLRNDISFKIFDTNTPQEVFTNQLIPKESLITIETLEGVDEKQKICKFAHNWDYYKDLPKEVLEKDWEQYKKDNIYKESNFIDTLSSLGVDNWLITKEPLIQAEGKQYYVIPHKNINSSELVTPIWNIDEYVQIDHQALFLKYYTLLGDLLTLDIKTQSKKINIKHLHYNMHGVSSPYEWEPYITKNCVPYTISTDELKNNKLLYVDHEYQKLHSEDGYGNWFIGEYSTKNDFRESYCYLPSILIKDISPTVSKDPTPDSNYNNKPIGKIQVKIKNQVEPITIPVQYTKRNCQAYTNTEWKEEVIPSYKYKHWVLSDNVLTESEKNNIGKLTPYFNIQKEYIRANASNLNKSTDELSIPYDVYPQSSTIEITIPQDKGKMEIKTPSTVTKQISGNSIIYTIKDHAATSNGIASGVIEFKNLTDSYKGTITIKAIGTGLNVNKNLNVDINNDTNFIANITKQKVTNSPSITSLYSSVDNSRRYIIVGDGETVEGTIHNEKGLNNTGVKSIKYESLPGTPVEGLPNINPDLSTDGTQTNNKQSELVRFTHGNTGNNSINFTLSHSKDYGYFVAGKKVIDSFYKKHFSLDSVQIDESKVKYEIVKGNPEATEKNKQKAILEAKKTKLNDDKNLFVNQNRNTPASGYTLPYYYEQGILVGTVDSNKDYVFTPTPRNEQLTPVGKIKVTYTDEAENKDIEQEFIVCVKIMQTPAGTGSDYGLPVPPSYYLK